MTAIDLRLGAVSRPRRDHQIDALRGLACLLLVTYHVIGSDADSGLHVEYPHPLRVISNILVDVRMPIFAFVAGYVYRYKHIAWQDYSEFMRNRLAQLAIPGMIAITLFIIVSNMMGTKFSIAPTSLWEPYFFSYAHFWYLQALIIIIALYPLFDMISQKRDSILLFLFLCALYIVNIDIKSDFLSIPGAIYLAPYFALGVVFHTYEGRLNLIRSELLLLSVTIFSIALFCDYFIYGQDLAINNPRDWQSLACGICACVIARYQAYNFLFFASLEQYSFVIYLYHVFGTSSARRFMEHFGLYDIYANTLIGVASGIFLPIVLYHLLDASRLTRKICLGRHRSSTALQHA